MIIMAPIKSVKLLAFRCMQVWQQKRVNVRSWNGCVATSPARLEYDMGSTVAVRCL